MEWIDTVSQRRKALQAWEEKLGRVFQITTKVSKNLEAEENMVKQVENNIENFNKKIKEAQNPSTRLPDISNKTAAITVRFAITIVQAQSIKDFATQAVSQTTTQAFVKIHLD